MITLTRIEADDPAPRKALAEMALADDNFEDAYKYAQMSLHIDVLDADIHRLLGASLTGLKRYPLAITEYETALELKPGDAGLQVELARALVEAGRKADAKTLLEKVLGKEADNKPAKELLESIKAE